MDITIIIMLLINFANALRPSGLIEHSAYRLSNTTIPSQYIINLSFDETNFSERSTLFDGCVSIKLSILEPKDSIVLHSGVAIFSTSFHDKTSEIPISSISTNDTTDIVSIKFKEKLPISSDYTLKICFIGELSIYNIEGASRLAYTNNDTTEYLIVTQLQATYARDVFPCFDEPKFKATFKLQLSYPSEYTAISNMPERNTIIKNETKTTTFQESPLMSTYLIAFTISKFTCSNITDPKYNYQLKVCSLDTPPKNRELALEYGQKVINAMSEWIQINYTKGNSKMDQIALPGFTHLAMENWGMVTYHEYEIFYDESETSYEMKQFIAEIIAHEFAHQWFGNLVTTSWWNSLFLNEGFSTYFQYFLVDQIGLQNYEMEKQLIINQKMLVFPEDSYLDSSPLTNNVTTVTEIEKHFGDITYNKGSSVIKMIESVMGMKNFQEALRYYIEQNAFKASGPETLCESLGKFTKSLPENVSFSEFVDNWINKEGFPVVTVTAKDNDVILSQHQFLFEGKSERQWYIPITYLTSVTNISETVWLQPNENITLNNANANDNWIIVNHKSHGYYRVKYDSILYQKLAKILTTNHTQIADIDRAQIVDDIFNFALASQISYLELFQLLNFLKSETSYFTWFAATKGFKDISKMFDDDSDINRHINNELLKLIKPINFSEVDWNATDHLSGLRIALLGLAACKAGQKDCIMETQRMFKEFKDNNVRINPNLRYLVYCNALKHSNDSDDWMYLWKRYHTYNNPHEKLYIIQSLGCTLNESLLNFYLNSSLDSMSCLDFEIIWNSVYTSSSVAFNAALNFILDKTTEVFEYCFDSASNVLSEIIENAPGYHISKITDFLNKLKTDEVIRSTVESSLSEANRNSKRANKIKPEIEKYFNIHPSILSPQ